MHFGGQNISTPTVRDVSKAMKQLGFAQQPGNGMPLFVKGKTTVRLGSKPGADICAKSLKLLCKNAGVRPEDLVAALR